MRKALWTILATLMVATLLLVPMMALADNAEESTLGFTLEWGEGINANTAHNTWYSAARHWVALVYEGDVWVTSTADYGASWDSSRIINEGNTTFRGLAVWYDEPNDLLHMARVADGNLTGNITDVIYHSSYIPDSSGNLNAISTEIAVEDGYYVQGDVGTITIACDEQGYPWIAWTESEFLGNYSLPGYYWVEVSDSDTNNGSWIEVENDGWQDFDGAGSAAYGHDYDALYGEGNWTAIAVNLCPVGATGDLMQLSWSLKDTNNFEAGIDATIWDGTGEVWGNLTWVVPVAPSPNGLYPEVIGEISFSFYDVGSAIHAVYADYPGRIHYQAKSAIQSWDDVSGHGNWTVIGDVIGNILPAIAGYDAPGVGEDLIVVYHDQDSLYYDTKTYGGNFTGTWTEIWDVSDHGDPGSFIFLHSLQYKYGAGSPVGFAWDYGDLEWDDGNYTGVIDYWWVDQDGVAEGEDVLGWYYAAPTGAETFGSTTWLLMSFLGTIVLLMVIVALFRMDNKSAQNIAIVAIIGMIFAAIVLAIVGSFS